MRDEPHSYRPAQKRRDDSESRYHDNQDGDERDYYRSRHVGTRESPHRSDHPWEEEYRDQHMQRHYEDMYEDRPRNRAFRYDYDDGEDYEHTEPYERRHTRSRSRSPQRDPGEPSDTIILEGIPDGPNTEEVRRGLMKSSIAYDLHKFDVRLSGSSGSRRAFVQFPHLHEAKAFMREHFPKLYLQLPYVSESVPDGELEVFIHYARGREDDARANNRLNWNCRECHYSNFPSRNHCKQCGTQGPELMLPDTRIGAQDVGTEPSQILVVYPLPDLINEDMLEVEMKKLELDKPKPKAVSEQKLKSTAPSTNPSGYGARPESIHRIFLVRNIKTNESFKYGFVEFWTIEDAVAAMKKFEMASRFTVLASPATVGFIHMGVFVSLKYEPSPQEDHLSFKPLFNPEVRVRYRDEYLYANAKIVTSEPPSTGSSTKAPASTEAVVKKIKKRKMGGEPGTESKKRPQMAGTLALWQQRHGEIHDDAESTGQDKDETRAKVKITLSGPNRLAVSSSDGSTEVPAISTNNVSQTPEHSGTEPAVVVHAERFMCFLCMLKFKSNTELVTHQDHKKHVSGLQDPVKVSAAAEKARLSIKALAENRVLAPLAPESEYRDRAKERRIAFNQTSKPAPLASRPSETSQPKRKPVPSALQEDKPKGPEGPTKGAGMLAKMGWTTGSGLGANSEGRTDIIVTNKYRPGVGLGVEGGNIGDAAREAEKRTLSNSYADYVESVNDRARERYKKME